jgi:hypothetical protein
MTPEKRIQALRTELGELIRGLNRTLTELPEDPKLWSKHDRERFGRLRKRHDEIVEELIRLEKGSNGNQAAGL